MKSLLSSEWDERLVEGIGLKDENKALKLHSLSLGWSH